jgi:hypothetical protein
VGALCNPDPAGEVGYVRVHVRAQCAMQMSLARVAACVGSVLSPSVVFYIHFVSHHVWFGESCKLLGTLIFVLLLYDVASARCNTCPEFSFQRHHSTDP